MNLLYIGISERALLDRGTCRALPERQDDSGLVKVGGLARIRGNGTLQQEADLAASGNSASGVGHERQVGRCG